VIETRFNNKKKTHIKDRNFWQVLERLPLSPDVVDGADDDDVFQFVVVEVGSSQRHHLLADKHALNLFTLAKFVGKTFSDFAPTLAISRHWSYLPWPPWAVQQR
jgi:hypothetical protein